MCKQNKVHLKLLKWLIQNYLRNVSYTYLIIFENSKIMTYCLDFPFFKRATVVENIQNHKIKENTHFHNKHYLKQDDV